MNELIKLISPLLISYFIQKALDIYETRRANRVSCSRFEPSVRRGYDPITNVPFEVRKAQVELYEPYI